MPPCVAGRMELVAGCYEQVLFGFAARPAEVTGEGNRARQPLRCALTAARQPNPPHR